MDRSPGTLLRSRRRRGLAALQALAQRVPFVGARTLGRDVGTAMGSEFLGACERISRENRALYRKVVHECVAAILGDEASAEAFLLALDGLPAEQHP